MILPMNITQSLVGDVGVDLRGDDVLWQKGISIRKGKGIGFRGRYPFHSLLSFCLVLLHLFVKFEQALEIAFFPLRPAEPSYAFFDVFLIFIFKQNLYCFSP